MTDPRSRIPSSPFSPPFSCKLVVMRAFLLAPITLIVTGMLSLQICRAKSIPDRPSTTVSAAQLEQRSPFHAITSSLVARAQVIDPSVIPDQVSQNPPMSGAISRR